MRGGWVSHKWRGLLLQGKKDRVEVNPSTLFDLRVRRGQAPPLLSSPPPLRIRGVQRGVISMGIIFLLACSALIAFFLRQGCFDFVVGSS